LSHLTYNVQGSQFLHLQLLQMLLRVLRSINELGIPASMVINSNYYGEIDPEKCISWEYVWTNDARWEPFEEGAEYLSNNPGKMHRLRPVRQYLSDEAIRLVHKAADQIAQPPVTEDAWFEERGRMRGVDFSRYKIMPKSSLRIPSNDFCSKLIQNKKIIPKT